MKEKGGKRKGEGLRPISRAVAHRGSSWKRTETGAAAAPTETIKRFLDDNDLSKAKAKSNHKLN